MSFMASNPSYKLFKNYQKSLIWSGRERSELRFFPHILIPQKREFCLETTFAYKKW